MTPGLISDSFDRLGSRGVNEYDSRAQFYYQYSALVLYSFGLQNALEVSSQPSEKNTDANSLPAPQDRPFLLLRQRLRVRNGACALVTPVRGADVPYRKSATSSAMGFHPKAI
jgi:hypothetical protein